MFKSLQLYLKIIRYEINTQKLDDIKFFNINNVVHYTNIFLKTKI